MKSGLDTMPLFLLDDLLIATSELVEPHCADRQTTLHLKLWPIFRANCHFALSYFHLNIIAIAYRQRERIWFKEIKRKISLSIKLAFIFFFNLRITINKRKNQHFIMIEQGIVNVSLTLFWVQISKKNSLAF